MIHSLKEEIRFPEQSKITGYVLVGGKRGRSKEILDESIHLFFGGFGANALFGNNDTYAFCLLVPDNIPKLNLVSVYSEKEDFAFIEGTFYDREILARYKRDGNRVNPDFARWIFNSRMKEGPDFLKSLNGHYSGFVYESATDRLFCFSDRFNVQRQFIYEDPFDFVLTNNIFCLSKNRHLKITVDEEAVRQILQLDYPLGRNSEFKNISHILPSDILVRKNGIVSFLKIEALHFDRKKRYKEKSYIQNLYDRIDDFMKFLNYQIDEPLGIFISRGKDSRMFLHFLEKYDNYQLFNFMTRESAWSLLEGKQVEEIAEKLSRDLFRLEDFTIDRNLAVLAGMNTTATSSWMALAQAAAKHVNYAFIGHGGDVLSGKIEVFRYSTIKTKQELMRVAFEIDAKGVTPEDIHTGFPRLGNDGNVMEAYFESYENSWNYPLYDVELKHLIENRWFRHSVPIQHKTDHYLTPIYPYLEKHICDAYFCLPLSLIRSQSAHAALAALEKKSGTVSSTEFPVSLNLEKHARPLMMAVIKINNRLNDRLFRYVYEKRARKKAINATASHENQSTYLKETVGGRIELGNRQLLHRLKILDAYLTLSLDTDFSGYRNRVKSIEYITRNNASHPLTENLSLLNPIVESRN